MNNSITAKDCSPFLKNQTLQDFSRDEEQAIEKLCMYFESTTDGSKDDDDPIASLRTTKYEGVLQSCWWAGRYIGLAKITIPKEKRITQVEISIHPRFGQSILLAILEDLYNIKVSCHDGKIESSNEWFSSLLNILRRRIWVDKCAKANRYGLPRMNIKRGYQGVTMRGALNVNRTIMPWLMKKEVCTNFYEKTFDDSICRIVYEAHRVLSQNIVENKSGRVKRGKNNKQPDMTGFGFAIPSAVQDTINTLNSQYKGTAFNLTEADYQHIRYKSIYLSWKPLVDFSWDVIRNRQLSYHAADSQTQCIFVDMAEIWESFLRKKLGEGFANDGWRVLSIDECIYKIYKGKFYQRDIIPDIILEREQNGQKEYMVFDAKYKRMRGIKSSLKYSDVDRSDLFQIHTYMQYVQQNMGKVVIGGLLYPITQKGTNDDGTAFENTDIDMESYHSTHLFGDDGKDDTTPFIIDGILFSEVPEVLDNESLDEQKIRDESRRMAENIGQMIKRIKQTANL
jgi:5-methylcytosine-specific restriction endonuclease McrBC regulatory subunit McrC